MSYRDDDFISSQLLAPVSFTACEDGVLTHCNAFSWELPCIQLQ